MAYCFIFCFSTFIFFNFYLHILSVFWFWASLLIYLRIYYLSLTYSFPLSCCNTYYLILFVIQFVCFTIQLLSISIIVDCNHVYSCWLCLKLLLYHLIKYCISSLFTSLHFTWIYFPFFLFIFFYFLLVRIFRRF